eukprot:m.70410 g.70410  ORF g.70410 m.70410 type:complete len:514 (-) comp8643_c0_seq2:33-1574(-)
MSASHDNDGSGNSMGSPDGAADHEADTVSGHPEETASALDHPHEDDLDRHDSDAIDITINIDANGDGQDDDDVESTHDHAHCGHAASANRRDSHRSDGNGREEEDEETEGVHERDEDGDDRGDERSRKRQRGDTTTSSAAAGDGHESESASISTVYLGGFPDDVLEREVRALCRFLPGYERCQLLFKKRTSSYVKFKTPEEAVKAIQTLHQLDYTEDGQYPLKAELANRDLKIKTRPRSGRGERDALHKSRSDLRDPPPRIRSHGDTPSHRAPPPHDAWGPPRSDPRYDTRDRDRRERDLDHRYAARDGTSVYSERTPREGAYPARPPPAARPPPVESDPYYGGGYSSVDRLGPVSRGPPLPRQSVGSDRAYDDPTWHEGSARSGGRYSDPVPPAPLRRSLPSQLAPRARHDAVPAGGAPSAALVAANPADTLCVRGLDDQSNLDEIEQMFSPVRGFVKAKIQLAARGGAPVAFVKFATPEEASAAVELMQGFVVQADPLVVLNVEIARRSFD